MTFPNISMATKANRKGTTDISNKQMLKVLMGEMKSFRSQLAILSLSLKEGLDNVWEAISSLHNRVGTVEKKVDVLSLDVHGLKSEVRQLRFKVDENQVTLITNDQDMEKRIKVLEAG